jgi:4-hydroxy-tetrahydrodipicolinate reductase
MSRYRVIQWGAGNVGKHALRGISERPELELVGLRVYDDAKVGCDAGQLLDQAVIGIRATDDVDALLALDADCVVYNALGTTLVSLDQPVDDLVRILESGKNCIASSIDLFIYPRSGVAPKFLTDEALGRLQGACQRGGSTLYGTGMTPGYALDLLPITLTRVCRNVEHIRITELVDLRDYRSTMMEFMGFGLAPDADAEMYKLYDDPPNSPYAASMTMVANALGAELDEITYEREVATMSEPLTVAAGVMPAGTVVATRFWFTGSSGGRPLVTIEYIWRLTDDVRPDWPVGHCKWLVDVEGDPSIRSEMEFATATDAKRPTSITVAMHCLNAIPAVCSAPPGLVSHFDLPVFGGRALGRTPLVGAEEGTR